MDDETKARFDALDAAVEKQGQQTTKLIDLADTISHRLERHEKQLDAIVARLDEQDASHDRLMTKVDRLATRVDQLSVLARAGEDAITSLDALARRVAKLEAALRDRP